MLVKSIINTNDDINFSHSLVYSFNGPLLDLIHDSKKSNLIPCKYVNPLFFIFNLRQIIKCQKADIIHSHQPIDAIYSFIATCGLKVKIIRSYHGYEDIYKSKPGLSFKSRILYIFINRFVCLNLFVSDALLNYFRIINPGQLHNRQKILYNGISTEDLKKSKTANLRVELGISKESILLGMIGSFTKVRDHFSICKALKSVLKFNPDLHFLFIGKTTGNFPELYNKCHYFCEENGMLENVHFIGERNDIGGILGELNLYVHSSNNDTFGIALVEAMLVGVPCIASDIPALREISDDGKCVTLFERGNEDDLYNKIFIELKNINSVETKERINKAKEFAEKNFSIQAHIANLHKFYSECLK